MRSPLSLLLWDWANPGPSAVPHETSSSPFMSLVALCWTCSSSSMSFIKWEAQSWLQHSTCSLTSTMTSGMDTSLVLLATLFLIQAGMPLAFWPPGHTAGSYWAECQPACLGPFLPNSSQATLSPAHRNIYIFPWQCSHTKMFKVLLFQNTNCCHRATAHTQKGLLTLSLITTKFKEMKLCLKIIHNREERLNLNKNLCPFPPLAAKLLFVKVAINIWLQMCAVCSLFQISTEGNNIQRVKPIVFLHVACFKLISWKENLTKFYLWIISDVPVTCRWYWRFPWIGT